MRKGPDQLCSNCTADQHFYFRTKDSTIPLFSIYEVLNFWLLSVAVQPGLCRNWSKNLNC